MDYNSAGTRLFYDERGAGSAVVLLHPTPVDHHFWLPAAEALMAKYRVLLPDLRGHGASPAGSFGVISIEQLGRDVLALLDELRVERAIFAGCSIGSYTLYELWRQAPERIAGLVFCCGKPHGDAEKNRRAREEWMAEIRDQGTADPFFRRMLDALVGKPAAERDPGILVALRAMMNRMTPEAAIAIQRGLMQRPDSRATATTVTTPAMVIAGELDTSSTPAEMRELAELLPRSSFHLIEGTGHYAPFEQPQRVGALLREFCDSVSGGV